MKMRDEKNLDLEKRSGYNKLIHWNSLWDGRKLEADSSVGVGPEERLRRRERNRGWGCRASGKMITNGLRGEARRRPDERLSSGLTEVTIAEGGCGGEHANV